MVVLDCCHYFQGSITLFVVDIIEIIDSKNFLTDNQLFSDFFGLNFSICHIGTGLTGIYCVSCVLTSASVDYPKADVTALFLIGPPRLSAMVL